MTINKYEKTLVFIGSSIFYLSAIIIIPLILTYYTFYFIFLGYKKAWKSNFQDDSNPIFERIDL